MSPYMNRTVGSLAKGAQVDIYDGHVWGLANIERDVAVVPRGRTYWIIVPKNSIEKCRPSKLTKFLNRLRCL